MVVSTVTSSMNHRTTSVMKTSNNKLTAKNDNATTGSLTSSTTSANHTTTMMIVPAKTTSADAKNKTKNSPKLHGPKLLRWLFGGYRLRSDGNSKGLSIVSRNKNFTSNKNVVTKETNFTNPATISFLRLARARRFDDIVTVLTLSTPAFKASWLQVQQGSRSSICECLHALCLYRPTPTAVKVVQDAIKSAHTHNTVAVASPSVGTTNTTTTGCISECVVNANLVTDAQGRTPLHIAVACGCSYAVIEKLLQDDTEAAYMMDHSNRYPLHWACTCSHIATTAKAASSKREHEVDNVVKIINRLMEIYAMAVISKDDLGCTPLDIAKLANADPRIINTLQFVKNTLPVKKRIKSYPDEATVITGGITKHPIREAICIYNDDHTIMDDVSSIGSRGVSKARRRRTRSGSPKRSSSRVRELVDI